MKQIVTPLGVCRKLVSSVRAALQAFVALLLLAGIGAAQPPMQPVVAPKEAVNSVASADEIVHAVCATGTLGAFRHGTKCTGFYGTAGLVDIRLRGQSTDSKYVMTKELVHAGIDIAAPAGSDVRPIADGRVIDSVSTNDDPNFSSLGYMVLVKHAAQTNSKDTYSIYLHLGEAPAVKVSDAVVAGTSVLGRVGSTGAALGPHIHFEIRHFEGRFSPKWKNIYGKESPASEATFDQTDFDTSWVDPLAFRPDQPSAAPSPSPVPVSQGPDVLSDLAAIEFLESRWNKHDVSLVLGQVKFVQESPVVRLNPENGEDAVSKLPFYRAFAAKGFIKISDEKNLADGNFKGWDGFFEASQNGVRRIAKISATDTGKKGGEIVRKGKTDSLWVKVRTAKVQEIVANDPFSIGSDRYRIIQGAHTWDLPADMVEAWKEARGPGDTVVDRRFKVLIKYDLLNKQWNLLTADIGPRDKDLATRNVEQAVQILKLSDLRSR